MAITKTKFINYTRCPYYYHLDKVNLLDKVTLKEYLDEEYRFNNDIPDEQLEVMLPYYKKVEELVAIIAPIYFNGSFSYAYETSEQECFECKIHNIQYACYVDIYNETDDGSVNIIEVKATTFKKFRDSKMFEKSDNGIYAIKDLDEKVKTKLLNRYDNCGKYIYDLAVQRYIVENDLRQNSLEYLIPGMKYYLAVLNDEYVFNGEYKDDNPIYNKDANGNEIISYIDLTDITQLYIPIINKERINLEKVISSDLGKIKVGSYCGIKKVTECIHKEYCFKNVPDKNSTLCYLDSQYGFKKKTLSVYDLINQGMVNMTDVPIEYLDRKKNIIQYNAVKNNKRYIDYQKIEDGISIIKYPIYHLDFETFPCPLPRFKGEKCYTQSVFQFSLHIEDKNGCDKELSHYGYLAYTNNDEREKLIRELCKYINKDGTVLVYNSSFEKNRLKELAHIFPHYKEKLDYINNMVFDLLDILSSNQSLYSKLGYSKEENDCFNFYDKNMNGSFSIKKVLPLFSDLDYHDLEVSNGVEAMVTYSKFNNLDKEEYDYAYNSLVEYCKQDTWAMVEILHGLQSLSKNVKY